MRAFNIFLQLASAHLLWTATVHIAHQTKELSYEKLSGQAVNTAEELHVKTEATVGSDKKQDNQNLRTEEEVKSMAVKRKLKDKIVTATTKTTTKTGAPADADDIDIHAPFDAFNTPSVQCRLGMEQWQNDNIDQWMKQPPYPLLQWMWELTDEKTNSTYYKGLMEVLRCGGKTPSCTEDRAKAIADFEWTWQDQFGENHKAGPAEVSDLMFEPRLYLRLDPPAPKKTEQKRIPQKLWPIFKNGTNPTNVVYNLEPFLKCNKVEKENPPPPQVKIGACITRFWGQHDLMPEWIIYHRMIGIQHFWFFVSEPFENIYESMPGDQQDITYVPYNFTWEGHKHNGDESMITTPNGWSAAGGENWWQNMANNQCLYMAKQSGLDWIISPDVDEYIAIHDPSITHNFGVSGNDPSPLQQYFDKYHSSSSSSPAVTQQQKSNHTKQTTKNKERGQAEAAFAPTASVRNSQVCLHGGGYGRHPKEDESIFQLSIDFTHRRDRKMGNGEGFYSGNAYGGAQGRKKCFYNPRVIIDVGIHSALGVAGVGYASNSRAVVETNTATDGSLIELYHFRSPMLGPVAQTKGRKRIRKDQLVSYPEVRDTYRDKVLSELRRLNWTLPQLGNHVCKGYKC